ncbi:homocysteine S-methyltransferase [Streptococcus oriscaviae]|uniref:Homocysteine S-methyltransferase n=1 Tax=Streptococcus oriscaviae TaxID=2781599 RepID=A0ABX7YKC5_9STRE|nr:homocysteine S-methyltransferase [Streptococcus oriscaviae]QUE53764.1 homocysteine S-methyltransferase [Streptococcus oriscaviae]
MGRFKEVLAIKDYLILHGALGTELEFLGYDVSGNLWSAKYLLSQPEVIKAIHETYLQAGADILTTSSYQATIPGLVEAGLTEEEAKAVIVQTVELALAAREQVWSGLSVENKAQRTYPLISGCVGPYAAYLANGSEYTGDYGTINLEGLKNFHRPRIQLLLDAGAELLCLETIPNSLEVQALVELLAQEFPEAEAYMSFTAQELGKISDGTPLAAVISLVKDSPQILALGFNCTAPSLFDGLLGEMAELTDKPLVSYPNSGEVYDGLSQTWQSQADHSHSLLDNTKKWRQLGSKIVGGCCRTRPADIASLAAGLK